MNDAAAPELATQQGGGQPTGMAHGGTETPIVAASADEPEISGGGSASKEMETPPDGGLDGDAATGEQAQEYSTHDSDTIRNMATMTTLEWSASKKGPDDDIHGDDATCRLDVMLGKLLVDTLESCDTSKESWPESGDIEIITDIAQWFDRRKELGDIALIDPVMAQFADEYATLRAKYDERSNQKKHWMLNMTSLSTSLTQLLM